MGRTPPARERKTTTVRDVGEGKPQDPIARKIRCDREKEVVSSQVEDEAAWKVSRPSEETV
jgi:hypothetical protein